MSQKGVQLQRRRTRSRGYDRPASPKRFTRSRGARKPGRRATALKVLTVLGTRPEIIRLSLVIKLLDSAVEHTLVHTGQNFDDRLDGLFFRELGVRAPDVNLGARGGIFGEQVGLILVGCDVL